MNSNQVSTSLRDISYIDGAAAAAPSCSGKTKVSLLALLGLLKSIRNNRNTKEYKTSKKCTLSQRHAWGSRVLQIDLRKFRLTFEPLPSLFSFWDWLEKEVRKQKGKYKYKKKEGGLK